MAYVPPTVPDGPRLPFGCYRVWFQSVDHKPSKKGDPMSAVKLQVLAPDRVTLQDGQTVDTAGAEGTMYLSFSPKALPYTIRSLIKLGIQPPTDTESEADFIAKIQVLLNGLVGQTFEITARSIKSELRDATGQPLKDGQGRVIEGQERPDFNASNIVGNLVTLADLGISPTVY